MKRYEIYFTIPNRADSATQKMVISANDSASAVAIFKASYPGLHYTGSYRELR